MEDMKTTCYDAGKTLENSAQKLMANPNDLEVLTNFLEAAGAAGACGYPFRVTEVMQEGIFNLLNIYISAGKGKVKDSPEFIAAVRQIEYL